MFKASDVQFVRYPIETHVVLNSRELPPPPLLLQKCPGATREGCRHGLQTQVSPDGGKFFQRDHGVRRTLCYDSGVRCPSQARKNGSISNSDGSARAHRVGQARVTTEKAKRRIAYALWHAGDPKGMEMSKRLMNLPSGSLFLM